MYRPLITPHGLTNVLLFLIDEIYLFNLYIYMFKANLSGKGMELTYKINYD